MDPSWKVRNNWSDSSQTDASIQEISEGLFDTHQKWEMCWTEQGTQTLLPTKKEEVKFLFQQEGLLRGKANELKEKRKN